MWEGEQRRKEHGDWRLCGKIDGKMLTWDGNRGRHLSYQRGKRNTNPGTSLIQIEGVENTEAAKYVGQSARKQGKY